MREFRNGNLCSSVPRIESQNHRLNIVSSVLLVWAQRQFMVQLIFKSGPHNGSAMALRPGLNRIGRNPANDIQIAEPSVSGFHCELHVSPLGVAFRDVGSSNGSFIEGRRVDKAIISSPKTLRLGAIELDVQVPVANVAIPEQKKEPEIFANFMPDGAQACQAHAGVAATFLCLKCEKTWCAECVRRTG